MKNILFILMYLLVSVRSYAEKSSLPQSISVTYLEKLKASMTEAQNLSHSMKTNFSKACPDYSGKLASECFKSYILQNKMRSSTDVVLLSTIAASSAVSDKNNGLSKGRLVVNLCENLLSIIESIDLSNFYLSEIIATTNQDKIELALLKKDDEKEIETSVLKILTLVEKKAADSISHRSLALDDGSIYTLKKLLKKSESLKLQKWQYK